MLDSALAWLQELVACPTLKALCAAVCSFSLQAVGHPDSAFLFLFYLMMADYLLGFVRAWKSNNIRRDKMIRGAYKFLFNWVSVALLVLVDKSLGKAFRMGALPYELQDFYIAYLCIGEFFSCSAHLTFFGVRFPQAFMRKLDHYRLRIESGVEHGLPERKSQGGDGAQ